MWSQLDVGAYSFHFQLFSQILLKSRKFYTNYIKYFNILNLHTKQPVKHNWWWGLVHAGVYSFVTTEEAAHGTVRLSLEPEMMELMILNVQTNHTLNFEELHLLDVSGDADLFSYE